MATVIEDFITECRARLGDTTVMGAEWTDTQISYWVKEAIQDYSKHFPRLMSSSDLLGSDPAILEGVNETAIDIDGAHIQGVHSVAYPSTDDPPTFLKRKDHRDPDFYTVEDCYDFEILDDANAILWISGDPVDGDADITFICDHVYPAATEDLTVPQRHFELLIAYVRMAAWQEVSHTESQDPHVTIKLLNEYEAAAQVAAQVYQTALKDALRAEGKSSVSKWDTDAHDMGRIY